MSKLVIGLFVITLVKIHLVQCAKILSFITIASYSHQVMFQPLWKELSLKGHQVTVITTNPVNDATLTNLTEIDISFSINTKGDVLKFLEEKITINGILQALKGAHVTLEKQLDYPPVKNLINDSKAKFDLVFVEHSLPAPAAIAKKFKCPIILVASTDPFNGAYAVLGNPVHPIAYPNSLVKTKEESLTARIESILNELVIELCYRWYLLPLQQKLVYDYFGHTYDITDLIANASAFFVNTHPLYSIPRALTPNIIQIGGYPIRLPQNETLTKDVKDFLDNAKDGFIYFSLGSNVRSKDMAKDTLTAIISAFKELPYRVLWKYESDNLADNPSNVLITKWVSQSEVLSHPNIKLFITHGGTLSIEEGIFARVPLLCIPVYLNQPLNVQRLVRRGLTLSIDYHNIEKEDLKSKILEMIENPIYLARTKEFADLVEDRPMNGLDLAVWWTEYVLRHKGAKDLRSPFLDIPWYQYYLLDVLGIFLFILIIMLSLFFCTVRYSIKLFKNVYTRIHKLKMA